MSEEISKRFPEADLRISVLGHIQRGGSPSCMERVNASRMGYSAVKGLVDGRSHEMVGIINREIVFTSFTSAVKQMTEPDNNLLKMTNILAS